METENTLYKKDSDNSSKGTMVIVIVVSLNIQWNTSPCEN